MRVLAIVDDSADVRRMVRGLLERAGLPVDVDVASPAELVRRLRPDDEPVVVLGHHRPHASSIEGAEEIRARTSGASIVVYTSAAEPVVGADAAGVAAVIPQERLLDLPRVVRDLRVRDGGDAEDEVLAMWLRSPSPFFEDLPPPVEAAVVVRQLFRADANRSDDMLQFVAGSGDIDRAVAHLLGLRRIVERHPRASALVDVDLLDLLIVEATTNVIASARRDAMVDPLTGVGNRRALDLALTSELGRAERLGETLTAVYFDLVGLKARNDEHGHEAGDRSLRAFAHAIEDAKRSADRCFRTGGDEFVVLLPNTSVGDATEFVGRLRDLQPPDFSWGAADTAEAGFDGLRLVRMADIRMTGSRYGRVAPRTAVQAPSSGRAWVDK